MKSTRRTLWLTALLTLVITGYTHAESKRHTLTLKNNQLIGLPKEYQPATFNLEENTLRIKNHEMKFPAYITSIIPSEAYELKFISSWSHDNPLYPPEYLEIEIVTKGRDVSYHLVFDMNTLDFQLQLIFWDSRSPRCFIVQIPKYHENQLKKSVTEIKE